MDALPYVVAIVADDAEVRAATTEMMELAGYKTEVYASVSEFLEHAHESTASCLVVDAQFGNYAPTELGPYLESIGVSLPIIYVHGSDEHNLRSICQSPLLRTW
jgi:FixJ family two-component response regulator